jgi:stage V sporulation protein G
MQDLIFKVEKMFKLTDAGGLKAFVDVSINNSLVIKGVRVVEGRKGIFVSMPKEKGKDDRWYDQVVCKSAGVYDELSRHVLEHYQNDMN